MKTWVIVCAECGNVVACKRQLSTGEWTKKDCWRCIDESSCVLFEVCEWTHTICGKCQKKYRKVEDTE
jgi:hypothetical protein